MYGMQTNHKIKTGSKSFERVEQFKYLGEFVTNQNCIHVEIRADGSQGMFAIFGLQLAIQNKCKD
jgi:hypothetical protein